MKEYIERNAALKEIEEEFGYSPFYNTREENDCIDLGLRLAMKNVMRMPAADVVEVVRCKDCKHYIHGECYVKNHKRIFTYDVNIHHRREDDYCSYGERKEK